MYHLRLHFFCVFKLCIIVLVNRKFNVYRAKKKYLNWKRKKKKLYQNVGSNNRNDKIIYMYVASHCFIRNKCAQEYIMKIKCSAFLFFTSSC